MMKTKLLTAMSVLLMVCLVLGSIATTATTAQAEESHDIYFIDPTAVATVGNYLFVADNVDEGKTGVVMRFSIADNGQPTNDVTVLDADKRVIGLSGSSLKLTDDDNTIGSLYVVYNDEAVLYDVHTDGSISQNANSYTHITDGQLNGKLLVDACVVNFDTTRVAYLTEDTLYLYALGNKWGTPARGLTNTKSLFFSNGCLYYIYNGYYNRINSIGYTDWETDKQTFATNGFSFTYTTESGEETIHALYDNKTIDFAHETRTDTPDLSQLNNNSQFAIVDVAATNNRVYVLDNQKQVRLYTKTESTNLAVTDIHIGSDTVTLTPPTDISGFTLARSNGYPTNIVYRTQNATSSIENILDKYTGNFVILDYDGSHACPYYYVLIGNRFGWIKKSSANITADEDDKITVLSSSVNDNAGVKARFTSLSDVYVYDMPFDSAWSNKTKYTQSAQNMTEVAVLQVFKQDDNGTITNWYYVEFSHNQQQIKGFVKQGDLGQFSIDQKTVEGITATKKMKINSTLFEAVTVYATSDLTQGMELYNSEGIVKLYSGDRVFVISESTDGKAIQIGILHKDNTADFGWVDANRLVDVNSITANTIAGLSFLGGAILLAILLLVVFRVKKNKNV